MYRFFAATIAEAALEETFTSDLPVKPPSEKGSFESYRVPYHEVEMRFAGNVGPKMDLGASEWFKCK